MAKKSKRTIIPPKRRVVAPELRAIWIVRDAGLMFDKAAMTMEDLKDKSKVSRATAHKVHVGTPVKKVMAQRVFRVLNANSGAYRDEERHVVPLKTS